jgi:threonylcarbamoyladenosine tRNA methylthiotransferase MtaB
MSVPGKPLCVAVTTLGCKINQFESAAMTEILEKDGFSLVPFEEAADVYVINTCTVTAKTDAESRRLVRRARRRNPDGRIVVTGCYAQVAAGELQGMPEVDLVIGNPEKKSIAELLRAVDPPRVLVSDIAAEKEVSPLRLESHSEHTRAFLQVQNGCDSFCSYCIVPHARGKSRSVPFEEVLEGIGRFAARGFREVVLTGIHLGAYGLDLSPRRSLLDVLREAEERRLVPRLRLGSVEPQEVTEELISFLAGSRIVCPHLHIPLQSCSDTVLGRMNRRYSTAFVAKLLSRIAADVPGIFLAADVIAGFPGETPEEFRETVAVLESLPLAFLHVFPFSPRPGTPAAQMPGQVPPQTLRERAAALREISRRKRESFVASFAGKELSVLVQESSPRGGVRGLSRNYLTVTIPAGDASLVNREAIVLVEKTSAENCTGRILRVQ